MDENSQRFIDDCFLRPVTNNVRTTNKPVEPPPSKVTLKTEMQVLRLSDDSQKMCMETLRSIHGDDFRLDDPSKYKDRGGKMKKSYWQDRGTLVVQSVTNFSSSNSGALGKDAEKNPESPEQRLRRYALLKLENYGFALNHCIEAYDHCDGNIDQTLYLLFRKYMKLPEPEDVDEAFDLTEKELLDMRNDEKEALESIYDKGFEEKEKNLVWNLKFKIEHLLKHSPSEVRKTHEAAAKALQEAKDKRNVKKPKGPSRCRNFDENGTCRFGPKCRFAHIRPEPEVIDKPKQKIEESDEKWFYLEVRFPPKTKYPYEAPYIYLKTTCHDIPNEIRLRIARKLYREAQESCRDGIPCVYSISELLQMESWTENIDIDIEPFPREDKSLFYVEDPTEKVEEEEVIANLPTHYEKGLTSHSDGFRRDPASLEKDDRLLLKRFMERRNDEKYKKMLKSRQNLPAFSKMMDILNLLETSQILVISGETGCGKSTQVPQFILDNWFFKASQLDNTQKMPHVEVICTQPRRLSAIGVAERVADERAERVGQTVGYQIRLENKISSSTRLTFCTTGILLRRLASEPLLDSVTHIIVDEVHERSEESDFLLMILKRILPLRTDLKVILMSATLNAKLFSDYFNGVPVLDIPGRTFPVEQLFLEDIIERCDFVMECDSQYSRKVSKKEEEELMRELEYADIKAENAAPPTKIKDEKLNLAAMYSRYADYSKKTCKSIYLMEPMKINPELIESVLKYIVEGDHEWPREGTILIFLPGLQEIQSVHDALCDSNMFGPRSGKYVLVPLHSTLSSEEQAAVFRPAPKGKRKIVMSTNIAETSVTIDDCVFVVDYGLMKEKHFDSNRNMESLELVYVSRANANQRKGRAGRVMPGVCIHLYTQHRFKYNFLAQPVPEIHRVPLEQLVLRIKTLPNFKGLNVVEVLGQTLEPPTEENIVSAVNRLQDVGALDEDQHLTPLGHHLSALPVDVRIGKLMLFGAIFQCLDSVLTIAACLSHKSPFVSPFNKRAEAERRKREFALCNSDHLTCLLAYKKWLDVSKRNFFASRNYADEHFLSLKTLQTISEVKYQFLELLVSIGFVPVNVPRKRKNANDNILELTGSDLNINGDNNRLLISLLCASLYPNIVKILTPERSYIQTAGGAMPKLATAKDLRFKTREDGYVAIHPSSVNADVGTFQSPFLVYQEKVKTSRIFIRECSMLPLVTLVLFAGSDLKVELHDGDFLFLLEDGWIIIKAHNHETAEMIQCLRTELLKLLEEKIRDPCLNLLNHENGRKIIQSIVYLIGHNN
ncbi:putative ATP-dependent RNA helicase DHX57 [Haematobia irritans]|uniref:putative ATP-dependent RNA helicase DHX57 n=1 Tax=Haematobia irritans TaxID=7368 RepID=UPI003F4FE015